MRLVVVSFVAAFALGNAAFAQSPATNPSGSAGNSPKQPANAGENSCEGRRRSGSYRCGASAEITSRRQRECSDAVKQ